MSIIKRDRARWNIAQKFEVKDWLEGNAVGEERLEAEQKYKLFFENFSKKVGVQSNWKILDVGCGPTCVSGFLHNGIKIGIEPLARKLKIDGKIINGVTIRWGKGEKLSFKSESFEIVVCRNVIDHTQYPKKVMEESGRVLKKNGYFILACYVYTPFIAFVKTLSERIPFLRNIGHPHTFTQENLEKLATDARFAITERKIIHTGLHPNDYGKINEHTSNLSFLQKFVIFINFRILHNEWFLKEYLLVLQKEKLYK